MSLRESSAVLPLDDVTAAAKCSPHMWSTRSLRRLMLIESAEIIRQLFVSRNGFERVKARSSINLCGIGLAIKPRARDATGSAVELDL